MDRPLPSHRRPEGLSVASPLTHADAGPQRRRGKSDGRPSLRDVAQLAAVSVGTASRVLSGADYPVSASVRSRVVHASEALGYVPNSAARALVTGRSSVLGAIVHDITDPYFGEVVRGIEDVVAEALGAVLVASDDRDPTKFMERMRILLARPAAGLILVGGQIVDDSTAPQVERFLRLQRDRGTPIVAVGRYAFDLPYVAVNELGAARLAVLHLLGLGHRRIAFLGGPMRSTTVADRYAGFSQAMHESRVAIDPGLVLEVPLSRGGGVDGVQALLAAGTPFTAIVAASDEVAFGAIAGLRLFGMTVPQHVSVVGFNGVGMCEFVDPALTSIRVPMRELGATAARLVASMQRGETVPPRTILDAELVVRASTTQHAPERPLSGEPRGPGHD